MKDKIMSSELILNTDGSIFHLHLLPHEIAEDIILVGDPTRVDMFIPFFDSIEVNKQSREFHTITGFYDKKRFTVISTGIGADNCDIVVNEIDALFNIDFQTRKPKEKLKSINITRLGTCGALQGDVPVGSYVLTEKAVGLDGMLNFYRDRDTVCEVNMEALFKFECLASDKYASPYIVSASKKMLELFKDDKCRNGITITANGFYGPQGRELRLPINDRDINKKIQQFGYNNLSVLNYEMESAAIIGLSALMGHNAICICLVIANRINGEVLPNYHENIKELIIFTLNKLKIKN